ncbi:AmiS/UreI family transporter [Leucobacter allii]|uniref:AmiS/UreI family transporter n=1 Tax=Leucobacter allii TaxID=2932247 RepID=UPI001FD0F3DF|nr:AmiS/UreI family transporter [Leucobacter allii]UOR02738.1 AmiS/UreI family transporter [Leucobacter allii]
MSNVGLLYVGAVLFINGLMLLGIVPGKAAAAMNLFVGGMQVVFPTLIILQSGGDAGTVLGASGLYLFGFTYLYVAWNQLTGAPGEGLGWFSLFVAGCAIVYGILQFTMFADPVFGVIWWSWAVLWFLFFLVLARGRDALTRTTGWFTLLLGVFTGAVPAMLLLAGAYRTGAVEGIVAAVLTVVLLALSWLLGRPRAAAPPPAAA